MSMAKSNSSQQQAQKKNANNKNKNKNMSSSVSETPNTISKKKRTRRSVPRDSPPQRSSIYRGVTRHRWTGRYEAHLWDKNCWNETQNKKGRQVYLGAYDDEEAAAHAYDLAALKYWGPETILNFPAATYQNELKDMEGQSREEYIGSLRRKSSGFSRGISKYRGVARHHHNGRWEARIGRVFGNKYLYLGTYATQEEAATAYDMAAIEYRGLNAVTNFDLSRYIKWLKPSNQATIKKNIDSISKVHDDDEDRNPKSMTSALTPNPNQELELGVFPNQPPYSLGEISNSLFFKSPRPKTTTSALGLLLQSSKFKEMMEMTSSIDYPLTPTELENSNNGNTTTRNNNCVFPNDIQTIFLNCENFNNYINDDQEGDDLFNNSNSLIQPTFQFDFDA